VARVCRGWSCWCLFFSGFMEVSENVAGNLGIEKVFVKVSFHIFFSVFGVFHNGIECLEVFYSLNTWEWIGLLRCYILWKR
jgi:hypothetical protein